MRLRVSIGTSSIVNGSDKLKTVMGECPGMVTVWQTLKSLSKDEISDSKSGSTDTLAGSEEGRSSGLDIFAGLLAPEPMLIRLFFPEILLLVSTWNKHYLAKTDVLLD